MKKIILAFLSVIISLSTVNAQKGIDFSLSYPAGGKMLMNVDSAAKNVFYSNTFPNQPHTSFNFLPEVNHVDIQIYFRATDSPQNYRYTILENNKPKFVNRAINVAQLKEVDRGDEEIFRSITFGTFPIKDNVLTILTYDIRKPQEIYTTVFYGTGIERARIGGLGKRFKVPGGVKYDYILDPKDKIDLVFSKEVDELTIVMDKTDIDYIYQFSIKDKQTGKTIFNSTSWQYGGHVNGSRQLSPYVQIERSIFQKSGDYEIIIQPLIRREGCHNCDLSDKDFEKYVTRHTLSLTLEEESYTKRELLIYILAAALSIGLFFLTILYFNKKRSQKKLAQEEQQKNIVKLQLNSIRSQLNPHFLFNALSGIQNLMNKNETDNANKYLSKFARLTRNVLDDKDLISLLQERTLLDDYLRMEQLRFGFQYEITDSEKLDLANIEIPSMLLQPFVENAVKHGISQKAAGGKVIIEFVEQASDLVLTVADNGNGYDTEKKSNGLGLPLSHSRIALLNSIYKENRFTIEIQSTTNGTLVRLTLTDWL